MLKISACCFIKDNNAGAFCLWESMAMIMPLVDEYVIMDLGSTDGTLEMLEDLARMNPKIRIVHSTFYKNDPSIFADLANDLTAQVTHDLVYYHQADEVMHEDLVTLFKAELIKLKADGIPEGWPGINFWRYQLTANLQKMKWWPHPVNHFDLKSRMHHVGDGMNTERPWDAPFLGDVKSGKDWQTEYTPKPYSLPTNQMILDVSSTGMFLDNAREKRQKHAPIWKEPNDVLYIGGHARGLDDWYNEQMMNPDWVEPRSPFNIPEIMKGHVGKLRYEVRPEILERIANA